MKLYVLCREDLGLPYSAVQGGHALAQWVIDNRDSQWNNGTLVYCQVPGLAHLNIWALKLKSKGYAFSEFFEPDINEKSALACLTGSNIFKNLKLLGQ